MFGLSRIFLLLGVGLFGCLGGHWAEASPANNQAPKLLFAPLVKGGKTLPQIVQEGKVFRRLVEAYDPDGERDQLTFRLTHNLQQQKVLLLPVGKRGCCLWRAWLIWVPLRTQQNFSNQISIQVTDEAGKTHSVTHRFQVRSSPLAPKITSSPVLQATQGRAYRYLVRAEDKDAASQPPALVYKLLENPQGMEIKANGEIRWTPGASHVGVHHVVVRVSDAQGLSFLQRYSLQVQNQIDDPVILSTPPKGAAVGIPYIYFMQARDADPDSELTYKLLRGPSGMKVHAETGVLRWVPTRTGTETIEVEVRQKGASGSPVKQVWTLSVKPTNRLPSMATEPVISVQQGAKYVYAMRGVDPDGDSLQFVLVKGPTGMKVVRRAKDQSELQWSPQAQDVGTHATVVRIDDGRGGVRWQRFLLQVRDVNDPPVFVSSPVGIILQHQPYVYQVKANDPEDETLQFSLLEAPLGMRIEPSSGRITWEARPQADVKKHIIKVQAKDARGAFAVQEFELVVLDENDPPILTSSPNLSATQGTLYTSSIKAEDPDGSGGLLFFRLVQGPPEMQMDMDSGELRWRPTQQDVGKHAIRVEVLDDAGGRVEKSYVLEVRDVNDAPVVVSVPVQSAQIGELYQYQILAKDPDVGDVLTFSLEGGPSSMTLSPQGLLTWLPKKEEIGAETTFRVQVQVFDKKGDSTRHSFQLQVFETNKPPVLKSEPPTQAKEGELYQHTLQAIDPDGDTVSFTLEQGPDGMKLDDKGGLRWTPCRSEVGTHSIQIRIDDKRGGVFWLNFPVKVEGRNQAPKIVSLPSLAVRVGSSYRYYLRVRDPDGAEGSLQFKLEVAPSRMKLDTKKGLLSWEPEEADAKAFGGVHGVVVKVTNASGISDKQQFFIHVIAPSAPPKLVSSPGLRTAQNRRYTYWARVEGAEARPGTLWFFFVARASWNADGSVQWGAYLAALSTRCRKTRCQVLGVGCTGKQHSTILFFGGGKHQRSPSNHQSAFFGGCGGQNLRIFPFRCRSPMRPIR